MIAYSYIRFSSPEQAKGDSLRRQTEATEAWCERNNVRLDTNLTLRDLGVSAFRGKHKSDKAALGSFLKAVEQGKVAKGSYLVIENLDRLSREDERTALRLWMDILDKGINIVQLSPETIFRHEKSDMVDIIRAIIELSRGHSESRMKSVRGGKAWEGKRAKLRKEGGIITRRLPAWVEEIGGKLILIPQRAEAIRRIFQLSAAGYGQMKILQALEKENIPAFGTSGRWNKIYLHFLLNDRRVLGEYQPRQKSNKAAIGEPIPNYFPPAITEDEWLASRVGTTRRGEKHKTNNSSKHVNVFAGLLIDARDGGRIMAATRTWRGEHTRILVNASGKMLGSMVSFSYSVFERALFSLLAEIDPKEIVEQEDAAPSDLAILSGELERVRANIAAVKVDLQEHGHSKGLSDALRGFEGKESELLKKVDDLRRKAATPLAQAWEEQKSLIGILGSAEDKDDIRIRIRTALSRTVEEIVVLIVPRGNVRVAFVQISFPGGQQRGYIIYHSRPYRLPKGEWREGYWWCCSDNFANKEALDLRDEVVRKHLMSMVGELPQMETRPETFHSPTFHFEIIPVE